MSTLKTLAQRLGLEHEHVTELALDVLLRITSGEGDVFTRRNADESLICYRHYKGGAVETLATFEEGDK